MLDVQRDVIEACHRQPVPVDCHATWCGPCRMPGPVIAMAVKTADGPLTLVTIDTDEQPGLAAEAGVSGIPDVRLSLGGRQIGAFAGFRPKPDIDRFIRDRLALARA